MSFTLLFLLLIANLDLAHLGLLNHVLSKDVKVYNKINCARAIIVYRAFSIVSQATVLLKNAHNNMLVNVKDV